MFQALQYRPVQPENQIPSTRTISTYLLDQTGVLTLHSHPAHTHTHNLLPFHQPQQPQQKTIQLLSQKHSTPHSFHILDLASNT